MSELAYGYQGRLSLEDRISGQTAIRYYAMREGLELLNTFVERHGEESLDALEAMITAAAAAETLKVVVIPSISDLGPDPITQESTRARLQDDAGVRVVFVEGSRR